MEFVYKDGSYKINKKSWLTVVIIGFRYEHWDILGNLVCSWIGGTMGWKNTGRKIFEHPPVAAIMSPHVLCCDDMFVVTNCSVEWSLVDDTKSPRMDGILLFFGDSAHSLLWWLSKEQHFMADRCHCCSNGFGQSVNSVCMFTRSLKSAHWQ